MASISSLSGSSSSSSIYGNRNMNIISGLASGLDTEGMIEGLVQTYKQKITGLQQDKTKVEWEQEAYQSISNKLVEFARKYMSYSNSSTNLFSSGFFTNAVNTTASGEFSNLVSAIGKSSSDVVLNAVKSLATKAKYTNSAADKLGVDGKTATGGTIDTTALENALGNTNPVTSGTITLSYGDTQENAQTITINIDQLDHVLDKDGKINGNALAEVINQKLADSEIDGKPASDSFKASYDATKGITFDKDSVSISGFSGEIAKGLEAGTADGTDGQKQQAITVKDEVISTQTTTDYLKQQTFTVNYNGTQKTITLGDDFKGTTADEVATALQEQLKKAFGDGKITVNMEGNSLKFSVSGEGNTFSIASSDATTQELLGLGEKGLSTYVNTNKTLGELNVSFDGLGKVKIDGFDSAADSFTLNGMTYTAVKGEDGETTYKDTNGTEYKVKGDNGTYTLQDKDGNDLYAMEINGETVGYFSKESSLSSVINAINNSEAGVTVSYSKLTNSFQFTANETGAGGRIDIAENTLGAALFGATQTQNGTDATIIATINGQAMEITRSSNTFDLDGMSVTVDDVFNENVEINPDNKKAQFVEIVEDESGQDVKKYTDIPKDKLVNFTSKTDTESIINVIKDMVTQYNDILKTVRDAYTTQPQKDEYGKPLEPPTDEDKENLTESELEKYEEKAKQGILFMDSDISGLYSDLRSAISGMSGELKAIGITVGYEDGLTNLTIDEEKLEAALLETPDKVQQIFTRSTEYGATSDGLMARMEKVTEKYAATTGATKGILIEKAGSQYAPTAALQNDMLDKMDDIQEEIEKWQDKMTNKVEFYTNKFTQLELLINQMNSQSSALAGFMGGY